MLKFIKRILSKSGWIICGAVIAVLLVASTLLGAASVISIVLEVIRISGGGSVVRGIILTPFFVLGVVQLIRGFGYILDEDSIWFENKFRGRDKGSTAFGLYIIATILGYMAVALAIVFWVNA